MRHKNADDPDLDANDYHEASQGLVVQLVNKVLFRFGSQSLIRRLLNGRSISGDMQARLLTSGSQQRSSRKGSNRAGKATASALLASTPSIGESPSLFSGFTAFMEQTNDIKSPPAQSDIMPLEITPEAFESMVRDTPAELVADVLATRNEEYGEYLRRLERARKELVHKLAELDDRILQAVSERKDIAERLESIEQRVQHEQSMDKVDSGQESASVQEHCSNVSPDAQVIVEEISDEDSDAAQLYESDDARRLRKLAQVYQGHYGAITALSSDDTLGLVASGSLDTQVRVWDMDTGNCQHIISGHNDIIRQVQFHDRFLLTASNDSRIRMWDLSLLDSVKPQESTMEIREIYQAFDDSESTSAQETDDWSNNSPRMIESLESTTPFMSPTMYRQVPAQELCCENTFVGHSDAVTCFQAAGDTLISGSADKTIREWDLTSGTMRQVIDITWATRDPQTLRVSSAATSNRRASWATTRSLRGLNIDNNDTGTESGDGGFIGALQFYEFALATGSSDGFLRLWDLRTAQAHRQMVGHSHSVTSLHFDDRSVVTGSLDGTAVLWDLRMGRMLHKLEFGNSVTSVQLVQGKGAHIAYAAECWIAARDAQMHHYKANSMQQLGYASDFGLLNSSKNREDIAMCSSGNAPITRLHCLDDDMLSGDNEGIVKLWNK
ncbi:Mitochondrial fission protein [Coemansia sp. RSA 1250]|nr:Mitochondrial fission protein [Coemansia sp. RSA 1250]